MGTKLVTDRKLRDDVRHATPMTLVCKDGLIDFAALQPIGFDGVRLQMLHPNGFAASFQEVVT